MTLTLSRVAEENLDVMFVFNMPGLVATGIPRGVGWIVGMGGSWWR